MAFPSINAGADGYKVVAVVDASGTYAKMAHKITLARVVQVSVVPMDTAAIASERQRTWHRDDAQQWAEIYTRIFPAKPLLIETCMKAQSVQKDGEALDSARNHHTRPSTLRRLRSRWPSRGRESGARTLRPGRAPRTPRRQVTNRC
ncbi:hypothetical protein ACUXAV_003736 [Cupriavidus metallidurans]|jgi:hypothetical protein|nr:hypothetical protein AU374_00455 [Cupriavidus metallidurans]